jgi:hypothetical protein
MEFAKEKGPPDEQKIPSNNNSRPVSAIVDQKKDEVKGADPGEEEDELGNILEQSLAEEKKNRAAW